MKKGLRNYDSVFDMKIVKNKSGFYRQKVKLAHQNENGVLKPISTDRQKSQVAGF